MCITIVIIYKTRGFFMKWYETNYVNHRDWILDNLHLLSLSANETIIVLLIDFMNEHNLKITMEDLAKRANLANGEVDKIISLLCAKQYLEIRANSAEVKFKLDGLFDTDTARDEKILDSPLFDSFETEFGRPLSPKEMEKISEWNRSTDRKMILYALREASAYQKLSFPYIDKILQEWKTKGLTLEEIDEGKY